MSQIAIKGHASRGKEVIEILETLGGKNDYNLPGDTSRAYYVLEYGEIHVSPYIYGNEPYTFFTLEEFESKYPFKVDDKVIYNEEDVAKIVGMSWDEGVDEIYYSITSHGETFKYPVDLLQPYKKENYNPITLLPVGDKVMIIPTNEDSEIINENGKFYLVKKQPRYPKTYKECCKLLGCKADYFFTDFSYNNCDVEISDYENKVDDLLQYLRRLIYCCDAYWKIAGDEMGLGKPWEPDWNSGDQERYGIIKLDDNGYQYAESTSFTFPTKEMRDAFYENFKELIENCKELL